MVITALRPDRYVLDRGDEHYRGGQVVSIVGGTTTIRLLAERNIVTTKTCATTLVPAGAQTVGCPICCRVTGGGAADYVIAEVVGSTFGANDAPRDAAAAVAAGELHPGTVPRDIHGEPRYFWTA